MSKSVWAQATSVLVPAMYAKRTSVPSMLPAPANLVEVTGHLTSYAGVVVTRLQCHTGGSVVSEVNINHPSEFSVRANVCAVVFVLRKRCNPSSPPVVSQAGQKYHGMVTRRRRDEGTRARELIFSCFLQCSRFYRKVSWGNYLHRYNNLANSWVQLKN